MGQAPAFKPIALIVEDDETQRDMVAMLLEESEMGVIECGSAEAALQVLDRVGGSVAMMFTDVRLTGRTDGLDLARFARLNYPNIRVIVTSGGALPTVLPEGTTFMRKPWLPLDLLREAERARH